MTRAKQEPAPDQRTCLVLMPMLAGFETIRATVARTVAAAGFEMLRLEVEVEDSSWHLWLLDALQRADVALVDLTGHNPYVMYELGCVHAHRIPAGYIVDAREGRITASVRGCACTPYGPAQPAFEEAVGDDLGQLHRAAGSWLCADAPLRHEADALANAFDRAQGHPFPRVLPAVFESRARVAASRGQPDPHRMSARARARHLLAWQLAESERVDVMQAIGHWCAGRR